MLDTGEPPGSGAWWPPTTCRPSRPTWSPAVPTWTDDQVYADHLLRPWFACLIDELPGCRVFDAHTHVGDKDQSGFTSTLEELLAVQLDSARPCDQRLLEHPVLDLVRSDPGEGRQPPSTTACGVGACQIRCPVAVGLRHWEDHRPTIDSLYGVAPRPQSDTYDDLTEPAPTARRSWSRSGIPRL
jgi:hypothetical protein